MLIFLFGEDTFRSRAKLIEILKRYEELPKERQHVEVIDCVEEGAKDVQATLAATSLFSEKKLLVLKNVFQNKDLADALFEQREALQKSADTLLFFEEEGNTHPLFLFLKENAKSQEFKPLTRSSTLAWAEKEFQQYGKAIEKDALALVVGETGNNLWRLSQEILKLASFLGKKTIVRAEDVKNLLHLSFEEERGTALELVSFHIKKGDDPLYILAMFAMQLRRKIFEVEQNSSTAKLEQSFEKVFETDKNIKTGRVEASRALYLFAAEV